MPSLTFGLSGPKSKVAISKPSQKRKNLFDDDENDNVLENGTKSAAEQRTNPSGFEGDSFPRPRKSPKIFHSSTVEGPPLTKYINLSSLHSAKIQDAQASKLDASVYDYDGL